MAFSPRLPGAGKSAEPEVGDDEQAAADALHMMSSPGRRTPPARREAPETSEAQKLRALAAAAAKESDPTVKAVLMEALTRVQGAAAPLPPREERPQNNRRTNWPTPQRGGRGDQQSRHQKN